jgi:hypothetical protein
MQHEHDSSMYEDALVSSRCRSFETVEEIMNANKQPLSSATVYETCHRSVY